MEVNGILETEQRVKTLESEIKGFSEELPYWSKYLADKILAGNNISDNDIDTAYSFLLEELKLEDETIKPEITIHCSGGNAGAYKPDLLLNKIDTVEGVNALTEKQIIEFCPNITIVYGANGSGKSGYIRLMKKVFYSKAPEEIIQNIHLVRGHKPVSAQFYFKSAGASFQLKYPEDCANDAFKQYAVFDGKSVLQHLNNKNEFEFRPAGLCFFAEFTEAINKVEIKLNAEITIKQTGFALNDLVSLFDGESEIKTVIQDLSLQTKISDLKKYTPFSEKDKGDKEEIEKKYDELLLTSRGKEKEIQKLESIRKLVSNNKVTIEAINTYFKLEYLTHIETSITDCISKEAIAKAEGIENFNTDKIKNVGSQEWKDFIKAAEQFAQIQKTGNATYPDQNDNCLLCQQPLLEDSQKLISSYWSFIKSDAEQSANEAQIKLTKIKVGFEKLSFDLFPDENILSGWLNEKYPDVLAVLKQKLAEQKEVSLNIISDLNNKIANKQNEVQVSVAVHDIITSAIDESIEVVREDGQKVELNRLLKEKIKLLHKEKFNIHFPKFETYIANQQWLAKSHGMNWIAEKRRITESEKYLTGKYFNQKYIDIFNQECGELNGNFGIEINHTGAGGTSYRQLTIKGISPAAILSEGEQKIIALADFLSEMQLSEVNRGIIFDDPVTSLDEKRKSEIAERLVKESATKQVIIFTHDLVFLYNLMNYSKDKPIICDRHWIKNESNKVGNVHLNNTPSHEKKYRNTQPALECYIKAKDAQPEESERQVQYGFAALRTCYEIFVINDLFANIVQRFNDRVSVMSLSSIYYDDEIINETITNFERCCKYMEGHSHTDKFVPIKPEPKTLLDEVIILDTLRKKHTGILKAKGKKN